MRVKWIYFLPCIVLTPGLAKAQVSQEMLNQIVSQIISGQMAQAIKVAPKPKMEPAVSVVSTVDPEKKTATLQFSNLTKDTVEMTLALAPDSSAHSLGAWIKNLPKTVKIPPESKQEVTVTLDVPKNAAAGTYSAIVKARGQRKSHESVPSDQGQNASSMVVVASIGEDLSSKLVYTVK